MEILHISQFLEIKSILGRFALLSLIIDDIDVSPNNE